jgi:D-alanyl-lipoteichoic acid acyltransferase DltB (MBOAT superfamily)
MRNRYDAKSTMLVVASLVFYAYHQWELAFLILSCCIADWGFGIWIAKSAHPKRALALGVAFNLSLLGFWKYTPLFLRTIAQLAWALDLPTTIPTPTNWIIPFGLSFYAFTGTAYLVDVYRRETPAETSFRRFTLNLVFFPHLVAGPILRASDFLKNLQPETIAVASHRRPRSAYADRSRLLQEDGAGGPHRTGDRPIFLASEFGGHARRLVAAVLVPVRPADLF